jgi:hypothetical protein
LTSRFAGKQDDIQGHEQRLMWSRWTAGKPCLSPLAPVEHGPDRGETMLGRCAPPEPGTMVLAAGARAAGPPYRLVMARYGRVREPSPGRVARGGLSGGRAAAFVRGSAWAGRSAGPRTRASRVSTPHEFSR